MIEQDVMNRILDSLARTDPKPDPAALKHIAMSIVTRYIGVANGKVMLEVWTMSNITDTKPKKVGVIQLDEGCTYTISMTANLHKEP